MKTIVHLALLCLFTQHLFGQLSDSFSDANLRDDPIWFGQPHHFVPNAMQLQLQNESAQSNNTTFLYTPLRLAEDSTITFQFELQLDFAPSSSNFAKVVLWSASPDLFAERQSVWLKIGGISGQEDAVELYHTKEGSSTLLLSGTLGAVGTAPVHLSIKVQYTPAGQWSLWADYGQTGQFNFEGIAHYPLPQLAGFFGLIYHYTSSRADQFAFDNLLVEPTQADTTSPAITRLQVTSDTTLLLHFSEPIAPISLQASNFLLPGISTEVVTTQFDSLHPTAVHLYLSQPLYSPSAQQLRIPVLSDYYGNASAVNTTFEFMRQEQPAVGDLLLTEIMADPTPSQGLPEVEYLEIYNSSDKVLTLEGSVICINQSCKTLPALALWPEEWLLLAAPADTALLAPFGKILGIPAFPSLPNSGATIALYTPDQVLLQELSYDASWYRDTEKAEGGFSLELQQLSLPNNCALHWNASNHHLGGSPSAPNSLAPPPPTNRLLEVFPLSPFELELRFQQPLAEAIPPTVFTIFPSMEITEASLQYPERTAVLVQLADTLEKGRRYELSVDPSLLDCLHRPPQTQVAASFGWSETPYTNDILINEMLFDPPTGGADYVELYNPSDKVINLNGFRLNNPLKEGGDTTTFITQDYLLFPQELVVLTEDTTALRQFFPSSIPGKMLAAKLPTLADDIGSLAIAWQGLAIDRFDYEASMHHPLLINTEGVALERLHPDFPTQNHSNWHSAAATVGFGTPTLPNSQGLRQQPPTEQFLSIPNSSFSPDGDGYEDMLGLHFQTEQAGALLHLSIFDWQGRLVQTLAQNTLLGTEDYFYWNGTTSVGGLAGIGIYIVLAELLFPDGKVVRERKSVVLALPLD
ncbi:MAG: lamin tail domain-containing protein [Bacteroidota bacterium]